MGLSGFRNNGGRTKLILKHPLRLPEQNVAFWENQKELCI